MAKRITDIIDITEMDDAHSLISPSGWKTWAYCSAAPTLVKELGLIDPPKKVTEEGSVAHYIHERALKEGVKLKKYKGLRVKSGGFTFRVNDKMIEAVQVSLDYVKERTLEGQAKGLTVRMLVEETVDLTFLGIPHLEKGTADVVLLFIDSDTDELVEIEVIDYKHGEGVPVYPERNGQAMQYAVGVLNLPTVRVALEEAWEPGHVPVRITIAQPRCERGGEPIRSWSTTVDELEEWRDEELIPRGRAVSGSKPVFAPSEDACMFCLAAATLNCPALQGYSEKVAIMDFDDEADDQLEKVTLEQKLWLVQNAPIIRSYLTKAEKAVSESMLNGESTYSKVMKLVQGKGSRKLLDTAFDEFEGTLCDHLRHYELHTTTTKSMTAIEKLLIKKYGSKKGLAIMSENVYKSDGGYTVVPIGDPREAINIGGDFDDLADDDDWGDDDW